ncbi:MAG: peptide ABC transporter substrate-binding protein [Negativicutes bacterium]
MIIFATTALFSGCGSKSANNNTITMVEGTVKTLDPRKIGESAGIHIADQVWEGLTNSSEKSEAVPAGAEKWNVSADGLTYIFYLRKNAKWSDGSLVTAHDYEYSWKSAIAPNFASTRVEDFTGIKNAMEYNAGKAKIEDVGVKAIDDYTLQVVLKAPRPFFPFECSGSSMKPVSKKACEANSKAYGDPKTMLFNGPFKISEYVHNSKYTCVRNDQYWDKVNVKPEKLVFVISEDAASVKTMLLTGQVDYIGDVYPPSDFEKLKKDGYIHTSPKLGVYHYIFNCKKKPFDDVRIRKAFALSVNRQLLIDKVLKGGQKPALAYVPYGMWDANPGEDFRIVGGDFFKDNDVETAKKLLAEAGYPDGKNFPEVSLKYNTSEGHKKIAEAIQEMWKDNLGINVKLVNVEWAVFQTELDNHDFDIARMGSIAGVPDASTFFDGQMPKGGSNYGNWENSNFIKMYPESQKLSDNAERMRLMHEAEKMFIADDMADLPIYFYVNNNAVNPRLKGYVADSMLNIYYKGAYKE